MFSGGEVGSCGGVVGFIGFVVGLYVFHDAVHAEKAQSREVRRVLR